jgi:predicted PurR-regulated permease PerM
VSTASGDGGDAAGGPSPVVVDVDLGSAIVFAIVAAVAASGWAIATFAPDMLTRLAVGLLLGVALAPLVAAVQRRWGRSRGVSAAIVGGALAAFFGAVVLLVAPPAVDQASQFSRELPATVRELYSWPVIGSRLERSDAA